MSEPRRVLILGAAGRDFHAFNTRFRDDPASKVVAFTATQIPDIDGRRYPPELAGSAYPEGIRILPEDDLEAIIREEAIDEVVFAYSDVSHHHVMHLASRVNAAGADFRLLSAPSTMLQAGRPVVAVCAVRTGSGKSQTTRRVTAILRAQGHRVAVVRHPMPYGDLNAQAVQRFATVDDLDAADCTIEEREEYEPHIARGSVVFAGVDYARILEAAEEAADVIVWDGGNNDTAFFRPDLQIVVCDPHRPGHELTYHPGETNLRLADVVVINKVGTADPEGVRTVHENVRRVRPSAAVIEAASPVTVSDPEALAGKRVLVVEDGPTLTHGSMTYGAGVVAARRWGAAEIVDPRPYAEGSLKDTYAAYPDTGPVLPAMGYGAAQIADLEATIRATPAEVVCVATPVDLGRLVDIDVPSVRVTYELDEIGHPTLDDVLERFAE